MPRVALFVSCLVDQFFPRVGFDCVQVLEKCGVDVVVPEGQTCCGQPASNAGYPAEAGRVSDHALSELAGCGADAVVVPSGSCASMLKRNGSGRPAMPPVFEFSQYLVNVLGRTELGARFPRRAVYHDSCHLLRELGERDAPRRLLREVRDLDLVELPEAVCCGFGGTFSLKMPEISGAMLEDKVHAIQATRAEAVVSADMGCLMHVAAGLRKQASSVSVLHLAEVLAMT